jgi:hypothetical protein
MFYTFFYHLSIRSKHELPFAENAADERCFKITFLKETQDMGLLILAFRAAVFFFLANILSALFINIHIIIIETFIFILYDIDEQSDGV